MYKCVNLRSPIWGILNSIIYIINIYIIIMNEKGYNSFIHTLLCSYEYEGELL